MSTILITGGSGSLGQAITEKLLETDVKAIRIFSNSESEQVRMKYGFEDKRIRYLIGDIKDKDRLSSAMYGVDTVFHCAALKHVDVCEYNPIEAVKVNILGSINVVDTATDNGVDKVLAISSDKAVHPVNVYGATKLTMEKVIIKSNDFRSTKFSVARFGNFEGSRDSLIQWIFKQKKTGKITVTHKDMTRFWISLSNASQFCLDCIGLMQGGEIFIPKMEEKAVMALVKELAPECEIEFIGIREGERLREYLYSEIETVADEGEYFVIDSR